MDWLWYEYRLLNQYRELKRALDYFLRKREFCISSLHEYAGKRVLDINEANAYISKLIMNEAPFMVCRFGGTEMKTINSYMEKQHFPYRDRRKYYVDQLCKLSGFFPNDMILGEKFVELMLQDSAEIDLCGIWNLPMEDFVLERYAPNANITHLGNLEPWNLDSSSIKPWTSSLKGKKILVIHPFAETINSQYYNWREHLFERKFASDDILPEFELITLKAVQTINYSEECGDFADWFAALNYMIEKCKNIDFDIAIIGCGAYGFPLAAAIKRMGRGAVHLGGATQ